MFIFLLYATTVLIWGTTWYAIKIQLGYAPHEVSIFYRDLLAALLMLTWCLIKKQSLKFSKKDHFFFFLLGTTLFSLHLLFVYSATQYLVSGIIAVVFSIVSFLTVFHNYVFFKTKPSLKTLLGICLGIFGLVLFFKKELMDVSLQDNTVKGLIIAGMGTLIFSFGSMVSRRNNEANIPVFPAMTMGMIYGTLIIGFYMIVQRIPFTFPQSYEYWMAVSYLAIPGSIVSFMCYLHLIKTIGPEKTGYSHIMFPIVALIVSSFFEGYSFSIEDGIGLMSVIFGNILVMKKKASSS